MNCALTAIWELGIKYSDNTCSFDAICWGPNKLELSYITPNRDILLFFSLNENSKEGDIWNDVEFIFCIQDYSFKKWIYNFFYHQYTSVNFGKISLSLFQRAVTIYLFFVFQAAVFLFNGCNLLCCSPNSFVLFFKLTKNMPMIHARFAYCWFSFTLFSLMRYHVPFKSFIVKKISYSFFRVYTIYTFIDR